MTSLTFLIFRCMYILLHLYLKTVKTENLMTPMLDLCDDGLIDTAVRIQNGSIYLFKGSSYFRINENFTSIEHIGNLSDWENLPVSPEIGFTITDTNNWLYGKTFFVKTSKRDRRYYVYENMKFIKSGSTRLWDNIPKDLKYAIVRHNDSILGIYDPQLTKFQLHTVLTFRTYIFDDYEIPTFVNSRLEKEAKSTFQKGLVRAAFQTPDKVWFVFFVDGEEGWYCIVKGKIGEQCETLYLWNTILKCPPEMRDIPSGIFFKLWNLSGLNLDKLNATIVGILISCILIAATFHIVVLLTFRSSYKQKHYRKRHVRKRKRWKREANFKAKRF